MSRARFSIALLGKGAFALLGLPALAIGMGLATGGCTTDAFCFEDCGTTSVQASSSSSGTGGAGGNLFATGITSTSTTGVGGAGGCVQTNGGIEKCDGIDNDCNGKIDDGIDFSKPENCGTCDNDCYTKFKNLDPTTVTCTPVGAGKPGKCGGMCAQDYYDLNGKGDCSYYCVKTGLPDNTCDGRDDDCNGVVDDAVDFCNSTTDCGVCNNHCVIAHGTAVCQHPASGTCDASNTQCAIASCDCTGPGNCWWDFDGLASTGCEVECDVTNGGVEICDGLDNDCNGKIDAADDLSGDTRIGVPCFGGDKGECAKPAHVGTTKCVGGEVVCVGPNVLHPGDLPEICDGLDNDCNGVTDDSVTDSWFGTSCGVSNNFPCKLGSNQCVNGAEQCVGAVNPGVEICNGIDDDCDGNIDRTGSPPHFPSDSIGPCNVPIPPPAGATSPCTAGALTCTGGVVQCIGATGPTSVTDKCGDDSNCNGILENQPNLPTDVHNCGSCGNDCFAGTAHANMTCNAGKCQFVSCQNGFWDLSKQNKGQCTYACNFVSAQEACNGLDDNCDGNIDEGVTPPAAVQVCGTSPAATRPECIGTAQGGLVQIQCKNGGWQCTFPTGVCNGPGGCIGTTEVCEDNGSGTGGALDNNCNGLVNENVANWGKPCASDDGAPPPGDGQCRTTGNIACTGPNSVACSAKKNLLLATQEICDGIDNDCDGKVDEPKSQNASGSYVSPAVVKIAASLWIMQYEASRPNSNTTSPGTGNGYFCQANNNTDPNCNYTATGTTIPFAPANTPLQKTVACSQQGKIPWFNVTPAEGEQTCYARGGHLCTTADWQTACQTDPPSATTCNWGYSPRNAASGCSTVANYAGTKFCNLGGFDFDTSTGGDQDGLLVTGSPKLQNCFANWGGLLGQAAGTGIYDLTGNLREITKEAAGVYPLMGGSFTTQDENGAACGFTFYEVNETFQLYDLGFRCCFTTDPT